MATTAGAEHSVVERGAPDLNTTERTARMAETGRRRVGVQLLAGGSATGPRSTDNGWLAARSISACVAPVRQTSTVGVSRAWGGVALRAS
jgi:hypothetical protein